MRKNLRKTALALALLMVLLLIPAGVFADDQQLYSVQAVNLLSGERGTLILLEHEGRAYIDPADAAVLAGAKGWEMDEANGNLTFAFGAERIQYTGHFVRDDRRYYPLKELMDTLKCKYAYDEEARTICFMPCSAFPENVLSDCLKMYRQSFNAKMIQENQGWLGKPALWVAAGYNIVGGLRIDQLWGGYTREKYETAIAGIMTGPEGEDPATELLSDADKVMEDLGTTLEYCQTKWNDADEITNLINEDYDAVIEAYNSFGEVNLVRDDSQADIGVFSVGDVIEIVSRVHASQNAAETYVNAVKYGIVENEADMESHLYGAAREIYHYYDESKPTSESVMEDVTMTVIENVVGDASKVIVTDLLLGMKNPFVEVTKLIVDVYGMSDKTNAIEMVPVCIAIQDAAVDRYSYSIKKTDKDGKITGEAALELKYCAILYLRAFQYAWEQYEFDGFLGPTARSEAARAAEAIRIFTAYDDEQLLMQVDNPELDLNKKGIEAIDIGDDPRQMDVNYLMEDGYYTVFIDRASIAKKNSRWEFKADVRELLTYTDAQIEALKVGDRITDFYKVEKISREEWETGSVVVIGANGYFPYFMKDYSTGLWYLVAENDMAVQVSAGTRSFYVTEGETRIYDNFSWVYGENDMMKQVATLEKIVEHEFYKYSDWIGPVDVVVENGKMTDIVFNYTP